MKLICFPHYTCGGLLCDILNNTFSPVAPNGGIASIHHSVGKIGDTGTIFEEFDSDLLIKALVDIPKDVFAGTHCWPGVLPLEKFNYIINITTATERSRVYRWARAYNYYYLPLWQNLTGIDLIDKIRETAKNYLGSFRPVFAENVYNLEFSEVVENTVEFNKIVANTDRHLERWRNLNNFLYDSNFWNRIEVKAYYQAVYELELNRYYVYE